MEFVGVADAPLFLGATPARTIDRLVTAIRSLKRKVGRRTGTHIAIRWRLAGRRTAPGADHLPGSGWRGRFRNGAGRNGGSRGDDGGDRDDDNRGRGDDGRDPRRDGNLEVRHRRHRRRYPVQTEHHTAERDNQDRDIRKTRHCAISQRRHKSNNKIGSPALGRYQGLRTDRSIMMGRLPSSFLAGTKSTLAACRSSLESGTGTGGHDAPNGPMLHTRPPSELLPHHVKNAFAQGLPPYRGESRLLAAGGSVRRRLEARLAPPSSPPPPGHSP